MIKHNLDIPMVQSGRFLINRKIIATVDAWNRDIKSIQLNQILHSASTYTPEQINKIWNGFCNTIQDFSH